MDALPQVVGGWLVEAVGGPFDGEILYLPYSETTLDVFHFYDERRTTTIGGFRPYGDNYLGYYLKPQAGTPRAVRWYAFNPAPAAEVRNT